MGALVVVMKISYCIAVALLLCPTASPSQVSSPAQKACESDRYQRTLSVFDEPQICPPGNVKTETYRLFVWPTFFHPLSIRIERSGRNYNLVAKNLSGRAGEGSGTLDGVTKRRLTMREWRKLIHLLNKSSFWTLAFRVEEPEQEQNGVARVCLDDISWYLEGVNHGQYQAVDRYCPKSQTFKAACLYMVALSGLRTGWLHRH